MKMKTAISILTITQSLSPVLALPHDFVMPQVAAKPQASATGPQCSAIGADELTITCAYAAGSTAVADGRTAPRIILNRAVISFVPSN
jgi:hypothetical protein